MVYYMYNADKIKDCRYNSEKSVESIEDAKIAILISKLRARLMRECAVICENNGLEHAYVKNICTDRTYGERYESQSWYVFKENGAWYYKQSKSTKTKHLIEGMA